MSTIKGANILLGISGGIAAYKCPQLVRKLKELEANVAKKKRGTIVVGFAAETSDSIKNARQKRIRKGIDAIVVNDVSDKTIGINSNENAFTLIHPKGEMTFAKKPKRVLADELLESIIEIFDLADQKISKIVRNK